MFLYKAIVITLMFLLMGGCGQINIKKASAEPSIKSVVGNLIHGQTIEIIGSNFGIKSPAPPVMWDDAEDKSVNKPLALISEGGWTDREGKDMWGRASIDSHYYDVQYRSVPFRSFSGPHGRSNKYIVGGHSNYRNATDSGYQWKRSGRGTNEYYVTTHNGNNPNWTMPYGITPDRVKMGETFLTRGTLGFLSNHQWAWGDNDVLGFNTIYVRDDAGSLDRKSIVIWVGIDRQAIWGGANVGILADLGGQITKLYVSYYTAYDPLWPKDGTFEGNNKILCFETKQRIYGGSHRYMQHSHGKLPQLGGGTVGDSGGRGICGGTERCTRAGGPGCYPSPINNWQKWEWIVDLNNFLYHKVNNTIFAMLEECNVKNTRLFGGLNYRGISIGGYFCYRKSGGPFNCRDNYDEHPDAFRYFDDVYIDITFARVILANNSNYDKATIIEPQIPIAWSDNSIIFKINLGKLAGSTSYLFVFDANNNHNSLGYKVTIE